MQDAMDIIEQHVKFDQSASTDLHEWQRYPEIPTSRDLNPDWDNPEDLEAIQNVLPNVLETKWDSKDIYLETHYRLQREEAIAMLRAAVMNYRQEPNMMEDADIKIYTKVRISALHTRVNPGS